MVLVFGRLPGSGNDSPATFLSLVSDLNNKLEEMRREGKLGDLLKVQVPTSQSPSKAKTPTRARQGSRARA